MTADPLAVIEEAGKYVPISLKADPCRDDFVVALASVKRERERDKAIVEAARRLRAKGPNWTYRDWDKAGMQAALDGEQKTGT